MIRELLAFTISSSLAVPTALSAPPGLPDVRPAAASAWWQQPTPKHQEFPIWSAQQAPAKKPADPLPPPLELDAVVEDLVDKHGGRAAIAVSDGTHVIVAGDDRDELALSTVKVPISVAALRSTESMMKFAEPAIRWSDNASTTAMYNRLPRRDVNAVIAETGSETTMAAKWGSTRWSTSDQARFVSHLHCLDGAYPVIELMGDVIPEQQWGLGRVPGTVFKSGWAPVGKGSRGAYVIRQIALVPGPNGDVALALTVVSYKNSATHARQMLNDLADGAMEQIASMPVARC